MTSLPSSGSVPAGADRYWRSPAVLATGATAIAFLGIGLRAILAPQAMSAGFGLPMVTLNEIAFVQVYGSRTMLLASVVLLLLWRRQTGLLAAMLGLACLLPVFDAALLVSRHGFDAGILRHGAYLALLLALTVLMARRRN